MPAIATAQQASSKPEGALSMSTVPVAPVVPAPSGSLEPLLEESRWQSVLRLPCRLSVDLPIPNFHVADILKLRVGSVVGTTWRVTRDVPLLVNGTLMGWSEFEVVGDHLAVRLTELA